MQWLSWSALVYTALHDGITTAIHMEMVGREREEREQRVVVREGVRKEETERQDKQYTHTHSMYGHTF